MNTAAASVPAVSASVIRIAAPNAAARPRASVTRGHGRWLATAAAAAIVVLTALTLVLNALEAQEGAEYGSVATNVSTASVSTAAR